MRIPNLSLFFSVAQNLESLDPTKNDNSQVFEITYVNSYKSELYGIIFIRKMNNYVH